MGIVKLNNFSCHIVPLILSPKKDFYQSQDFFANFIIYLDNKNINWPLVLNSTSIFLQFFSPSAVLWMGIFSLNFIEREWKFVEWEFLLSNGHLGIMARNHPLESLIKVWRSKMILSDRRWRWAHRKIILTLSRGRNQPFNRGFFQVFQKLWKVAILLCEFLHENSIYRKNEVHQDEANKTQLNSTNFVKKVST